MIQQNKSIQLPLVGVLLVGLLVAAFLLMAVRKRLAKADDAAGVVRHSVDTSAEDTLKYWTAEKMRRAKPAPMPEVKDVKPRERRKKRSRRPPA